MTNVKITALSKHFGDKEALAALNLSVASGEFVTLLGPSGCGKTTTLRCIAGLETPSAGTISLGSRAVVDVASRVFVPPEKRHIGMVFQSYALWPHMTVSENVSYPLKVARVGGVERRRRVEELLESVGLGEHVSKSVAALSGGQQQRVALARALVARPELIVYDEPLSNLDTKLRYRMSQQIRILHEQFGTTSIYVTHDQEEAIILSDRIVVMNDGRIEQSGTPNELYDAPASVFVADFMGYHNILAGIVVDAGGGKADVSIDGTRYVLSGRVESACVTGTRVHVAVRSGQIRVNSEGEHAAGQITGAVERVTYLGSAVNVLVKADGITLRVRADLADLAQRGTAVPVAGGRVSLTVAAQNVVVLPDLDSTQLELQREVTGELLSP